MSFTYTSALQGRIALAVWNLPNSGLNANQKTQLDATWTSGSLSGGAAYDAYTEISQLAQWFEQASSSPDTSYPQPAWDRLFVALTGMLLTKTVRPDRYAEFKADYETALDQTVDTFTRDLVSSTSLAGQGITLAGIRAYVIDHCVKRANGSTGLRRRLFPSIAQIDGHVQWVLNFIWNKTPWFFRKREVIMRIYTADITAATWTQSSKTLTSTGSFTNTNTGAGSRILIDGGTGIKQGEYLVVSRTSDNAVVLDTSPAENATDLTTGDITGKLQTIVLDGMGSTETFDSIASRKLFYNDSFVGNTIEWADASDMAKWKSTQGFISWFPKKFRFERMTISIGGTPTRVTTWHLSPFPDTNYTLTGAVMVAGPATLTTSTSLDAAIATFPAEFGTVIRDMTLARTLSGFGASDSDSFMRSALDQVDLLLPIYSDQGFANRQQTVEDVYGDYQNLRGVYGWY